MIDNNHRETSLLAQLIRRLSRAHDTTEETAPDVPQTEVYDLLASERRRHTLNQLAKADERVTVAELADHVAAAEHNCAPNEVTKEQHKRASVSLVQSHLPRFDEAGVVIYDAEYGTVSRGPQFEYLWQAYCSVRQELTG